MAYHPASVAGRGDASDDASDTKGSGAASEGRPRPAHPLGTARQRVAAAPATVAIAVACVLAFVGSLGVCLGSAPEPARVAVQSVWSLASCREALVGFGALEAARVWVDGEWWRVGTTGLLHGSWVHLVLNTWSLFVVGEWAERAWGRRRLVGLFAASSVGGCLASIGQAEAPMVVGASAGVLGIAGALLVARTFGRGRVREAVRPISAGVLGACLVLMLGLGFFVPLIAQAGHLGGLGIGVLLGLGWSRGSTGHAAAAGLGTALALAGLGWQAKAPTGAEGYDEFVGYRLLENGDAEDAVAALERALAQRPDDAALQNAIAYALAEAGVELERGRTLVEAALETEPDNPDFLDTLGWIECQLGHTEAGLTALDRADALSTTPIPEVADHRRRCPDFRPR